MKSLNQSAGTNGSKCKRFQRKSSAENTQKSLEGSRIARNLKVDKQISNQFLRTPRKSQKTDTPLDCSDFFKKLASSPFIKLSKPQLKNYINPQENQQKISRKQCKQIQSLKQQLQVRNSELDLLTKHSTSLQQELKLQKELRRKIETEKKQMKKRIQLLQRDLQERDKQYEIVQLQKQQLKQQMQFLERVTYDEKTQHLQSYREKYLEEEVQRLRKLLKVNKTTTEKKLQQDLADVQQEKYVLQSHYKALKIANQCLLKQLDHFQKEEKELILNSQEYIKLREKYKRFLSQYRNLRDQFWSLKTQVTSNSNHSSDLISMSITASQFEDSMNKFLFQ